MEDVLRRNELGAVPSEVFLRIHNNNNNNNNTSEKRRKGHFWRKARRKHNNSCRRNNYERNSETDNREFRFSETAPSCNDCVATIVTEQFKQTVKAVVTACPAFRKEIRVLFPRIPESVGFSGGELKLFYINF